MMDTVPSSCQPPAVKKQEELEELKDRAQLRLLLWLGLEKDQTTWTDNIPGGDVATFAETVSKQQQQQQQQQTTHFKQVRE